jgi:hypothetical protein
MPMPWARRSKASPQECGNITGVLENDMQAFLFRYPVRQLPFTVDLFLKQGLSLCVRGHH